MTACADKHGVFRINHKQHEGKRLTQFGRALAELGVELIYASSPQAKGRVERVNKTLQDRLIKWLRLKGISSIEEANAHIAIKDEPQKIKHILSVKTEKKLSKSLSFQHNKKIYQIKGNIKYRLQGKKVSLVECYDGDTAIYHNEQLLTFECIDVQNKAYDVHDDKTINHAVYKLKIKIIT